MEENQLSIKLKVFDRVYPITIRREDEERYRLASELVNENVNEYKKRFAYKDNQDLFAMNSLQLALQYLKVNTEKELMSDSNEDTINELDKILTEHFNTNVL